MPAGMMWFDDDTVPADSSVRYALIWDNGLWETFNHNSKAIA